MTVPDSGASLLDGDGAGVRSGQPLGDDSANVANVVECARIGEACHMRDGCSQPLPLFERLGADVN